MWKTDVYLISYINQSKFIVLLSKEISIPQRLKILRQVARTMSYIHNTGIVHRDLKSFNVLIDENLNVKVCDFGLAKFKVLKT